MYNLLLKADKLSIIIDRTNDTFDTLIVLRTDLQQVIIPVGEWIHLTIIKEK